MLVEAVRVRLVLFDLVALAFGSPAIPGFCLFRLDLSSSQGDWSIHKELPVV